MGLFRTSGFGPPEDAERKRAGKGALENAEATHTLRERQKNDVKHQLSKISGTDTQGATGSRARLESLRWKRGGEDPCTFRDGQRTSGSV